jgi:carbamate kinase
MNKIYGKRAVVALGGNAITRPGDDGSVEQDYRNLDQSLEGILTLLERGYQLLVTHGNGPQIGNQMLRVEMARGEAPILPLDVIGADLQGGLGYMIERVMRLKLRQRGMIHRVCCILSMIEVDAQDPAFDDPTKFVGTFYDAEQVDELRAEHPHWVIKQDGDRGWRRVVPSPEPVSIVQRNEIQMLLDAGTIVISGGGGGIPVARSATGELVGVEGVIDKDLASAMLALQVGAPELIILTTVERVMLNYGKPDEKELHILSARDARRYLDEGQFPPGSMGPKIEGACKFIAGGGSRVLITDTLALNRAIAGETGTWITV